MNRCWQRSENMTMAAHGAGAARKACGKTRKNGKQRQRRSLRVHLYRLLAFSLRLRVLRRLVALCASRAVCFALTRLFFAEIGVIMNMVALPASRVSGIYQATCVFFSCAVVGALLPFSVRSHFCAFSRDISREDCLRQWRQQASGGTAVNEQMGARSVYGAARGPALAQLWNGRRTAKNLSICSRG